MAKGGLMVLVTFKVQALERRTRKAVSDGPAHGDKEGPPYEFEAYNLKDADAGVKIDVSINDADEIQIGFQGAFCKWRPSWSAVLHQPVAKNIWFRQVSALPFLRFSKNGYTILYRPFTAHHPIYSHPLQVNLFFLTLPPPPPD